MSILQHLLNSYKLWHEYLPHLPKTVRYTIVERADQAFLETIELLLAASKSAKTDRPALLQRSSAKFELLKFLLQVLWEIKALNNNKYIAISENLAQIGKMLGGWLRQVSASK